MCRSVLRSAARAWTSGAAVDVVNGHYPEDGCTRYEPGSCRPDFLAALIRQERWCPPLWLVLPPSLGEVFVHHLDGRVRADATFELTMVGPMVPDTGREQCPQAETGGGALSQTAVRRGEGGGPPSGFPRRPHRRHVAGTPAPARCEWGRRKKGCREESGIRR